MLTTWPADKGRGCEWVRGELDASVRSAAAGAGGGVRGAGDPCPPGRGGFAVAPAGRAAGVGGGGGDCSGSPLNGYFSRLSIGSRSSRAGVGGVRQ